MARENQGLQIALITFVMLTVVLGASTVFLFNVSQERQAEVKKFRSEASKSEKGHSKKIEQYNELRGMIGVGTTEEHGAIIDDCEEEMDTYGGTYPEQDRNYRQLLKHLFNDKNQKDRDLVAARAEKDEFAKKLAERTSRDEEAFRKLEALVAQVDGHLKKVTDDYRQSTNLASEEQQKAIDRLNTANRKSVDTLNSIQNKLESANTQLEKLHKLNKLKTEKLRDISRDTFDVPDGEIRWVSQQTRTVWINLGRADRLMRQVSFSVYPADVSDLSRGGKKASIEVIRLLGEHSAEARIVDDKITDPIMPGDKIHTPAWSPGEQKRFALAGLLDVDGDGRSDLEMVRNLITMNGGMVDCYYNAKGEQIGTITANTRYLVLGKAPDEREDEKVRETFSRMDREAERWGSVQKIPLAELLSRMGFKKGSSPTTSDGAVPRTSTRGPGEQFKPRRPPARAGGAY